MDNNGIGIKATILIDGRETELELGCIKERGWLRGEWEPKLVWFEKGTDRYLENPFYSGGTTGFGKGNYHNLSSNFEDKQILTKNWKEAIQIMQNEEFEREIKRKELNRKKNLAVEKINSKLLSVIPIENTEFIVARNKATFNPRYSQKIECGVNVLDKKARMVWLNEDYKRKDGKLFKKRIIQDFGSLEVYEKVVAGRDNMKKAIKTIVDETINE